MKTLQIERNQVSFSLVLSLMLPIQSYGMPDPPPPPPPCPPPSAWQWSCPGIATNSSIAPLFLCATVGDEVCLPTIVPISFTSGSKWRLNYDDDCNPYVESDPITYTAGPIYWIPELPATLDGDFSSTAYVDVTSSDTNFCAPQSRWGIGTVWWTVNPMPTSISAVNWLPDGDISSEGWDDCKYGETDYEYSHDIGVYSHCGDNNSWQVKVTKFDARILQHVRLPSGPPPMVDLTSSIVAGTTGCQYLAQMKDSLIEFLNRSQPCLKPYGVLAAVQAHEDVHKAHFIQAIDDAFLEFKAAVEGLTAPNNNCVPASGRFAVKQTTGYMLADSALREKLFDVRADEVVHSPRQPFDDAEHQVIDPLIQQITERMQELNCP